MSGLTPVSSSVAMLLDPTRHAQPGDDRADLHDRHHRDGDGDDAEQQLRRRAHACCSPLLARLLEGFAAALDRARQAVALATGRLRGPDRPLRAPWPGLRAPSARGTRAFPRPRPAQTAAPPPRRSARRPGTPASPCRRRCCCCDSPCRSWRSPASSEDADFDVQVLLRILLDLRQQAAQLDDRLVHVLI